MCRGGPAGGISLILPCASTDNWPQHMIEECRGLCRCLCEGVTLCGLLLLSGDFLAALWPFYKRHQQSSSGRVLGRNGRKSKK